MRRAWARPHQGTRGMWALNLVGSRLSLDQDDLMISGGWARGIKVVRLPVPKPGP